MLATVLALLVVLLAGVFTVVDVLLVARLHDDLRTRLTDRVTLADQLDGALSPQQLVDRLRGDGVSALLCASGSSTGSNTGGLRCVRADPTPPPPGATGDVPPTAPPSSTTGRAPAPPAGRTPLAGRAPRAARTTARSSLQSSGSLLYVRTTLPSSGQQLTLSIDASSVADTTRRLIVLEAVAGVITLATAALVLYRLVGVALRPLDSMTSLARRIAAGDRGRRLHSGRGDTELGRTAAAFDAMLDELESAVASASAAETRQRQFLDDVSHELRTPLAGIAATVESLLRDDPDRGGRERGYVTLMRENRRAARLVDDLLTSARLDSGTRLSVDDVDLAAVAAAEVERVRASAPGLAVATAGADRAPLRADHVRVAQIVTNLLGNAARAAGPGGAVTVTVEPAPDGWAIEIEDDGEGVPVAERERIFERLVRLDSARRAGPGDAGGFGLGLPIARSLARAHGGDVVCLEPRRPTGARFRLRLPATDHPPSVDDQWATRSTSRAGAAISLRRSRIHAKNP